ncbi:hypothetical protein PF003_g18372 [Phytophthora fragariae]|nr:hypothetical protein PF003_g18372 [Phytophthora fragariae]
MDRRASSTCESFLSNDGSDDLVVRYKWSGEAIGLELMRPPPSSAAHTVVHWGAAPLGVTLGVEETSRQIIVTRSGRADVRAGDVLLQARGEPITEQNFAPRMAQLKQQRELGGASIPFVFVPPPPAVRVKKCEGALKEAGVDASFELRYVDGRVVRYLEMKELQVLIRNARKPCTMAFVQSKERQFYGVLQCQEQQRRSQQQLSGVDVDSARENPSKPKFYSPKKPKASAQEAAKQSEHLAKLQADGGNVDTAMEVLTAIRAAGGSELSKDVATTLLTIFVNENRVDKALQVLDLSYSQKIWLRAPPFETLITRCYKAKDFDAALQVFDSVQRANLSPSNVVYTTALLAAHRSRKRDLVSKILEKMLKDAKPYASRGFQVALSAAVKSRRHQLMLELMDCSKTGCGFLPHNSRMETTQPAQQDGFHAIAVQWSPRC